MPLLPRHYARELALKTLYQADVSAARLPDVLATMMEQARRVGMNPAEQALRSTSLDLQKCRAALGKEATARFRTVLKQIDGEVEQCRVSLSAICEAVVASRPTMDAEGGASHGHDILSEALARVDSRLHAASGYGMVGGDCLRAAAVTGLDQASALFGRYLPLAAEVGVLLGQLVNGIAADPGRPDALITRFARGWDLRRQSAVDRNILRLGSYELLAMNDIPAAVTLNEAVELAKKYGSEDSSRFVNGVLAAVATHLGRIPPDVPADAPEMEPS